MKTLDEILTEEIDTATDSGFNLGNSILRSRQELEKRINREIQNGSLNNYAGLNKAIKIVKSFCKER